MTGSQEPCSKCDSDDKAADKTASFDRAFRTGWSVVKMKPIVCDNCLTAAYDMIQEHSYGPFASAGDEEHLDQEQIAREMGEMLPDHICEMRDDPEEWKLAGLRCVCGCNGGGL